MSHPHLTFVEEIVLLALDDRTGARHPLPLLSLSYALAGAVLAELALRNRIDTDPEKVVVLSREPTGDPLFDHALATIAAESAARSVSHWLNLFSEQRAALERIALERLVAHGILRRDEKKLLWVFGVRRYPTINNQERIEVRTRLSALILGNDLPDPRDAVLISLLTACHLTPTIFSGPEYTARAERLRTLAKMDLVGREVAASLDSITRTLSGAVPPVM